MSHYDYNHKLRPYSKVGPAEMHDLSVSLLLYGPNMTFFQGTVRGHLDVLDDLMPGRA